MIVMASENHRDGEPPSVTTKRCGGGHHRRSITELPRRQVQGAEWVDGDQDTVVY